MSVREALVEWANLKTRLLSAYPELAEDDPALIDSLEGETNITDALTKLIRSAEDDRTMVAALSTRMSEMDDRRKRLETRMESKRAIASKAMDEIGLKRVNAPDFTATLAAGTASVVITDESQLPAHVLVQPPPKPDKRAIAGLLKAGTSVPGAVLSNAQPHLTVRRT